MMMKRRTLLFGAAASLAFLAAPAVLIHKATAQPAHPYRSHPLLHKRTDVWLPSNYINMSCEAEPAEFRGYDGKPKHACGLSPNFGHFRVREYPRGDNTSGPIVQGFLRPASGFDLTMPTVFDVDGVRHCVAQDNTYSATHPNSIRHYILRDPDYFPIEATLPVACVAPIGKGAWNTGVKLAGGGASYVMAVEISSEFVLFYENTNPGALPWVLIGSWTPPSPGYAGAVDLHISAKNGYFYLVYLIRPDPVNFPNIYVTTIAKGTPASGFVPWSGKPGLPSNYYPLAPDGPDAGVTNTSDLAWLDGSDPCLMAWLSGNQVGATFVKDIRTGLFNGSFDDYVTDFF